ncbi:unnamed protein product [Parnassius mnemosyne]|uniref:Transposase n=1 Tax=Parnassius mnemosyne TaxID=213953 RepID=A0AAV1L2Q7_9NEOP
MTAEKYRNQVLIAIVYPHRLQMGQDLTLMHDNARPHTMTVTSWLQDHGLSVLNPIGFKSGDFAGQSEHAWDMLQRRAFKNVPVNIATEFQLFGILAGPRTISRSKTLIN